MFITNAYAQGAGGALQAGGDYSFLILMGVMLVGLYFLMIRPQSKRQKEHQNMLSVLEKGTEVVLAGGIMGKISKVSEGTLSIEIANGVQVQVQRNAIARVLPKGTIKESI